ncbi:MAG: hypothetical protein ACRD50_05745 [Candidatus Acidiferrales bacterium]
MKTMQKAFLFSIAALLILVGTRASGQQGQSQSQQQKPTDMSGMDMGTMHHDTASDPEAARGAHEAMGDMHMDMGPHMKMTDLRPANPVDQERAGKMVETLRASIDKYKDYRVALADGFQIFLPKLPQPHYHFTNYRYAYEAQFTFNPEHPTSLLYKKTADGYELEGAMYTAPRRFTEDQLNERVPLSVARWHEHVNFCTPPKGTPATQTDWKKFGLGGTIATEGACQEAGGVWHPIIFGWMVHVYPYQTDPEKIWAH